MRRLVLLSLLVVLAAPACAENGGWSARPVPFAPEAPAGARIGPLRFKGALELASGDRRFGGLSGLHVSPEGHVTAVSDRGYFVEFDLLEDAGGTLIGATAPEIAAMTNRDGTPLAMRDRDAEDIAVLGDGTRLVVFERNARLAWFASGSARQDRTLSLLDLVSGSNEDIESVVPLGGDRLLMIAERLGDWEGKRLAWIGAPGQWQSLEYVPERNDDVSGAALLPNGDLLVLERRVGILAGFSARLCRVDRAQLRPGARLAPRTLVELAPPALADNFEGVATRPLADGRAAIYLVSDDNYFALQRTYLVKFETEAP